MPLKKLFNQPVVYCIVAGLIIITLAACGGSAAQFLEEGDPAPSFDLPTAQGGQVSLVQYQSESPVLLYFHMAVG